LSTDLGLTVESEVLYEVLLIGDFAYSFDDFQDTRLEDTFWQAGLTLKWLANAYSFFELAWRYETLDSVDPSREFDRNKVTLRVGLQY